MALVTGTVQYQWATSVTVEVPLVQAHASVSLASRLTVRDIKAGREQAAKAKDACLAHRLYTV